jgi:hypothetical protein
VGKQAHKEGEKGMQHPATDIDQMIEQLNQLQLPSSLMESFDAYREESVNSAAQGLNPTQLAWFLDMLNRFRGPDDHKESLIDVFDPGMYTCDHPAWDAAPGTRIELPALTSEVARTADRDSEFAQIARGEVRGFRDQASTYSDEEILGLAKIARAALADQHRDFQGREDAIRYLALNASARLENLWACDDTVWKNAPARHINFDDMVAKRKAHILKMDLAQPQFNETDFACFSEGEIRTFAFDVRNLFLTERTKHLAICTRCQHRLEYWSALVEKFDRAVPQHSDRADA